MNYLREQNTDIIFERVRELQAFEERRMKQNRAEMLLGLKFVDFTVIFDEKTPENLLDLLKPDIHVKGGDYKKEDLPETEIVEKNGGEVKILSFVDNISTTEIINKIIDVYSEK